MSNEFEKAVQETSEEKPRQVVDPMRIRTVEPPDTYQSPAFTPEQIG